MTWTKLTPITVTYSGSITRDPRPVRMLLRIAYGTQAQAARQLEVLRPSITTEETEEAAS
jgi:hypothetical protein